MESLPLLVDQRGTPGEMPNEDHPCVCSDSPTPTGPVGIPYRTRHPPVIGSHHAADGLRPIGPQRPVLAGLRVCKCCIVMQPAGSVRGAAALPTHWRSARARVRAVRAGQSGTVAPPCRRVASPADSRARRGRGDVVSEHRRVPAATQRLVVREMTARDLDDMAALLGDPELMRHYPRPKSRDEALAWIDGTSGSTGRKASVCGCSHSAPPASSWATAA
jgi:hypothetical protein